MKSKRRAIVPLRVALVLLCLVLISAHFTSGMFARYVTKTGAPGKGRNAKFAVSAVAEELDDKGKPIPITIVANGLDENGMASYSIKLSNPGETAVRYEAKVVFAETEDSHNAEKFAPGEKDQNLSFSGELAPGDSTTEEILLDMSAYFKSAGDGLDFSNDTISGDEGTVPFTVTVTFTQID